MLSKGFTPDEIIYRKLKTITNALNEGEELDMTDTNVKKWVPWYKVDGASPSGFAFCDSSRYCTGANAGGASRLCFETLEAAKWAGENFTEIFANIILK